MARKFIKRLPVKQLALDSGCTALYIRVSTEKQADEGYSLAAQQERLEAYCKAQDWAICPEHIYVDAGASGKTTERLQYRRMMEAAATGAIKRIVAIKLDRLARNTKDFLATVESLLAVGCDLVLIKESFDTSTPHGKFALTMFAAIAELEASQITERVMTGKRQKASTGGYNGSRAMLGYDYQGGEFTPNEHAATVKSIFDMFVGGESLTQIANHLNSTGVHTARGGKWQGATVRYILSNGFYAGVSRWDGIEVAGTHTPIVDAATYEAACAKVMATKPGPQPRGADQGLQNAPSDYIKL